MVKKTHMFTIIIFLLAVSVIYVNCNIKMLTIAEKVSPLPSATTISSGQIILIPLDDRPPCLQFVIDLAKLKGYDILTPPTELLGNYKTPANKIALRMWLKNNIKHADAAIISTDMLIHGGLWASRLSLGNDTDTNDTLDLLATLHQEYPNTPLYVFNIIPRLIIGDSDENLKYQQDMAQYSVLKDKVNIFENPLDYEKLLSLTAKIPVAVIDQYNRLYEANNHLNKTLIDMTEQGIIERLVLGQDDGKPFGIPNNNKLLAESHLAHKSLSRNRIYITRGTDEVALTLLGNYASHRAAPIKVHVVYSEGAQNLIMPYMPHSVEKTVIEKLALTNTLQVPAPEDADYILYVFVGTKETGHYYPRKAASQVCTWLNTGHKVALVDLSQDFAYHQTLLPYLVNSQTNLPNLIAYAGWNTTSNSVGTAVTQAAIFLTCNQNRENFFSNLTFTMERILDDLYYQKKIQPFINEYVKSRGLDPYNLNEHRAPIARYAEKRLEVEAKYLVKSPLIASPFTISGTEDNVSYQITDIKLSCDYPWPRTFEIAAHVRPTIVKLKAIGSK